MDFKRTKWILIAVFLALNIYLVFTYIDRRGVVTTKNQQEINIQQELINKNITYSSLSTRQRSLPLIKSQPAQTLIQNPEGQNGTLSVTSEPSKVFTLDRPIVIDFSENEETRYDPLKDYVNSGAIINGESYDFIAYYPTRREIVFTQFVNTVPVIDESTTLTFYLNGEGEVISYTQKYAPDLVPQGVNRMVISEKDAIEYLYLNDYLPDESQIVTSKLAYYRILSLNNLSVYTPVWYFDILSDDTVTTQRVDALNQTIIIPESKSNEALEMEQ